MELILLADLLFLREGEEFGSFYMRKWLGVNPADGVPVYEVIDPDTGESSSTFVYNDATVQIVGTSNPDFTGGFNTNIRYKDFTLSSNWSFSYGAELYNSSRNLFDSDGFYLQYLIKWYYQMLGADGKNQVIWLRILNLELEDTKEVT